MVILRFKSKLSILKQIFLFCIFKGDPSAAGGNGAATSGQDETFWNKFGTLGRKKKVEEVKEVVTEGKHAIDSPGMPKSAEMPPEVIS